MEVDAAATESLPMETSIRTPRTASVGASPLLLEELTDAKPAGPTRRLDKVPPFLVTLEDVPHPARRLESEISKHDLGADAVHAIFPRVEQVLDNLAPLVAAEPELPVAHPDMAEPCRVTHGIGRSGSRAGLQLRREVGGFNDEPRAVVHQVIQRNDLVP